MRVPGTLGGESSRAPREDVGVSRQHRICKSRRRWVERIGEGRGVTETFCGHRFHLVPTFQVRQRNLGTLWSDDFVKGVSKVSGDLPVG